MGSFLIEVILDASALEFIEPCPRKYYYSYIANLIPNRAHKSFDIGSWWHEVLAHFYSSQLKDTERLRSAFDFAAQSELFAKYHINKIDLQKFHRKRLAEYLNNWCAEDEGIEPIAVEKGFSYLLYEDQYRRYILEGKIDFIGKGKPYGLFVMDHKTQSRKDDRWEFNHQVCNYLNYMRKQGLQADYFVYNYIGLQDKLPPDGFRRMIYQPHEGMLEQWEKEVKLTFDTLYEIKTKLSRLFYDVDEDAYKRNRSACDSSKYGLCPYYKLCSVPDNSKWVNSVKSAYKPKEKIWKAWD